MWIVLLAAVVIILFSVLSIDARLKRQNANSEQIIERLDRIYDLMKKQDDDGEIGH